jgi:DNA-binding transcriptional LysR family regulator
VPHRTVYKYGKSGDIRFLVEINRLRQFCTLVETGNMRKAAGLLGQSPGALSKSMKQLKFESHSELFLPDGRGIVITNSGKRLYALARRLIQDYEGMLEGFKRSEETILPIRIASYEIFTSYFMGILVRDYFPNNQFRVIERVPGQIEDSVRNKSADFGLTYAPILHHELEFLKLGQFEKRVYVRRGAFKNIPFEQIPFTIPITTISGSPTGHTNLDGWPSDFPRNIKFQFELMETALETCRRGLSAIFIPEFVIPLHNELLKEEHQLELMPLPSGIAPVKRTIYLVKRQGEPEDKTAKTIARAIRKLIRKS